MYYIDQNSNDFEGKDSCLLWEFKKCIDTACRRSAEIFMSVRTLQGFVMLKYYRVMNKELIVSFLCI